MARLTAVSGFDVKGPACFLFEIAGRRLMLDLGRGPDGGRLPDLVGVGPVDAILISHGHADHAGGLFLRDRLGNPPVHMTEAAVATAAAPVEGLAAPLPGDGRTEIAGVAVETGPAGHAPGAVWMRIGGPKGLLYTGDLSDEGSLWRCTLPLPAAALLLDASYGDADEPLAAQRAAIAALAAAPLLLPAPAGGRGLEMAADLIAAGHPVALCPEHLRVARLMAGRPDGLGPGGGAALAAVLAGATPLRDDSPARGVMIAASANADGGMAEGLARRFAASGEARIVFTGHLAAGGPAEALVRDGKALFLRWNVHPPLPTLRRLVDAVAPRQAMPAFCQAAERRALAAKFPGAGFADRPEMTW